MLKAIRAVRCARLRQASGVFNKLCLSAAASSSSSSSTKYERKTPHEHVLLRPGMYVGQVEASPSDVWTFNDNSGKMEKTNRVFSPALIKLFDEILVNAADNKQRDKRMTMIDISVKEKNGKLKISIRNDGKGIPVAKHATEDMYIPELIFGHLLTGSNFDDSSGNLTGGRHGYGAKLTNIFSTRFKLETYDSQRGLLYKQQWEANMTKTNPPVIEKREVDKKGGGDYTLVSFEPDIARFRRPGDEAGVSRQTEDTIAMMKRRALDVAASAAPLHVSFNGSALPVQSFMDYVGLFADGESASIIDGSVAEVVADIEGMSETSLGDGIFHARVNDRWEIAIKRSPTNSFEHMSFVNSVWTPRGGSHERLVTSQVTAAVQQALVKRHPLISEAAIRNKLMVFVKCSVENPSFDSQSKDALTSRPSTFGSSCVLTQAFLKRFVKSSGVVPDLLLDISYREQAKLLSVSSAKGSKSQRVDVPKLEDAHLAGGRRALECTLILTEGDSAKALAVAGLEVVGRGSYGVFPLRGKMLNVRVAPSTQLAKNEELVNLIKTLGLDFNKTYENGIEGQGLRYGRVMMMCDQDKDGSHIKGLIINFFHTFWPHLLKKEGFLQQFITPLVKVRKGGRSAAAPQAFYSMQEYDLWRRARGTPGGDSVKYYKGLGTNTSIEGKEYFRALDRHRKIFRATDSASTDDAIDLVFSKSRAEDRRRWLSTKFDSESFVDPLKESVSYEEFIDKELIQFSHADNHRSIPSVVDGLKPAQRKILYGCFKRRLDADVKVVQLAGYIAEQTAYHHGDASLHATLINMAQDFVGSNNLPLLVPSGQFGTRAQGGKDFASPRYIFTRLSPLARALFPEADDAILDYLSEDGQAVEPKHFIPILPTLLINGSEGIGTGWSTFVPSFNPIDIIGIIETRLRDDSKAAMRASSSLVPWYRGFRGTVSKVEGGFMTRGVATVSDKSTIVISELPIGKWTNDYKEFLCKMVAQGEIKSFIEDHTTDRVKFVVQAPKLDLETADLYSAFRLDGSIGFTNMHAFDASGAIRRYDSPEDVVDEHFQVRLEAYIRRKESLALRLAVDEEVCRNKARFVDSILDGSLTIISQGRAPKTDTELEKDLVEMEFAKMSKIRNRLLTGSESAEAQASDESQGGYSYLLSMPISSLTKQRAADLGAAATVALDKLTALSAASPQALWLADLEVLKQCLLKRKVAGVQDDDEEAIDKHCVQK